MKNPAVRCFVAMAVGKPDTDQIYDKHILPTLRAANIHSTFMGRLEHNDDINKRIIEEIEECDFAITDLTYARPSVYFEAGFAERNVPVIYTCRRDHLHPQPDDKFGNLKVHFDLVTRNIISWSSVEDRSFARRLAKRVDLVTRPLLRKRQAEAAEKAEERDFERIALTSRLGLVSEKCRNVLKRHGYRTVAIEDRTAPSSSRGSSWVGWLLKHETLSLCALLVQSKLSERDIRFHEEECLRLLRWQKRRYVKDVEGINRVRKLVGRLVLCSLEKTPRPRLTSALPHYTADEAGNVFQWTGELPVAGFSTVTGLRSLPVSVSAYMFDPIRSNRDLEARSLELRHVLK